MQRGMTWLTIITTALLVAAVGYWGDEIVGLFLTPHLPRLTSVYLLPTQVEPLFNEAVVREHNIRLIHDAADVDILPATPNKIDVLYIHPRFLNDVEAIWLRERYQQGTFIVALGYPYGRPRAYAGIACPFA